MTSLQNLANLRFSTSASSSSSEKWQNQMKPQEFATVTTNAITQSQCIALVLRVMDHQRAGTKISEDLRSGQIPELSTKDFPKATNEVEL
jgi:hypothetical protein